MASVNGESGGRFTGSGTPASRHAAKRSDVTSHLPPAPAGGEKPPRARGSREPDGLAVLGGHPRGYARDGLVAAPAPPPRPRPAESGAAGTAAFSRPGSDLFTRYTRDYAAQRPGQPLAILHAGAATAAGDLGAARLRAGGAGVSVSLIDDDHPVTRAAAATSEGLRQCALGDLRTVPLPPRAFDIVQCSLLLGRIRHAELILDRLVAAIKPGGLLLLWIRDRDSAAGFLDRILPRAARRLIDRKRRGDLPGPYPAVYERLSSARGIHAYALLRGLVIAERRALGGTGGGLPGPFPGFLAAQKLIARLSGGRLTDAHEDLLYVLRKPENRFARVL